MSLRRKRSLHKIPDPERFEYGAVLKVGRRKFYICFEMRFKIESFWIGPPRRSKHLHYWVERSAWECYLSVHQLLMGRWRAIVSRFSSLVGGPRAMAADDLLDQFLPEPPRHWTGAQ